MKLIHHVEQEDIWVLMSIFGKTVEWNGQLVQEVPEWLEVMFQYIGEKDV